MRQILRYLLPYRKRIALGLFIKSLATFLELLLPWLLSYILDTIIPTKHIPAILGFGALMVLCSFLGLRGNIYANQHASRISSNAIEALRHDTYQKIQSYSNTTVDYFKIPSLLSRMTSDTYHIYQMFNMVQRIGVRAPIILFGSIILMVSIDGSLSIVIFLAMPLLVFVILVISICSVPFYDKTQSEIDRMIRKVRESIQGIRVIKALSKETDEKEKFDAINQALVSKETKAGAFVAILHPLMTLIMNLSMVAVLYVGIQRIQQGLSSTGTLLAFLSYITLILTAFMAMNRIVLLIAKASASASRINELLQVQEHPVVTNEAPLSDALIEFHHVSFAYPSSASHQLHDLSFRIGRNETFGIIGSTGSGKTTIAQLLLQLYDSYEGTIILDQKDLRSYDTLSLRRKFGVVFQNDVLFSDTIEENIRFGRSLSVQQLEEAAQIAQADAFIQHTPNSYQTMVQRGGSNFSGGQRQRLLIARALAANPEIIILDDASSALDYQTDANLRRSLKEHGQATTILITQRISTIMQADQILVLEQGSIAGLGTHETLLQECSVYQELYQIQLGGESHE